jgi:hypothetical protein
MTELPFQSLNVGVQKELILVHDLVKRFGFLFPTVISKEYEIAN